ncbi:hypothetical protein Tco_0927786 [Tanacetum coccineum]
MKFSLFMDLLKFPELAKWYSDKVPQTVDETMIRLDDFVRSEEAFASTELSKGEAPKHARKPNHARPRRDDHNQRGYNGGDGRRNDNRSAHQGRDNYASYKSRDHQTLYHPPRGYYLRHPTLVLILDSLTNHLMRYWPPKHN